MSRMISTASLHEQAVFDLAAGVAYTFEQRRQRRSAQSSEVSSVKPHPKIWKVALEQAHGDVSLLTVISETEVRVG